MLTLTAEQEATQFNLSGHIAQMAQRDVEGVRRYLRCLDEGAGRRGADRPSVQNDSRAASAPGEGEK
jgi:hypothetical protein